MCATASRWIVGLSLLLVAGVVGCVSPRPSLHLTGGFSETDTTYGRLLQRYSRSAELYDGVDTVAKGHATWRSPALRRAATELSIERFHLPERRAEQLRQEEADAAKRVREFHLALYTPTKDWNELETEQSLWRAYLELPGGEQLDTLEVEVLRKDDRSTVQYPYVTPWTREYTLRFPLLEEDEVHAHLTLVLTGPLGTLRFAF